MRWALTRRIYQGKWGMRSLGKAYAVAPNRLLG